MGTRTKTRFPNKETRQVYWVWAAMIQRCHNPRNKFYYNYGARGIVVCERWRNFDNFYADMGPRPEGHTVEREDNDQGYSPSNCSWLPRAAQNSNRRFCIYVSEDGGERVTLKEFCRRKSLPYGGIVKRIRKGESAVSAMLRPMR